MHHIQFGLGGGVVHAAIVTSAVRVRHRGDRRTRFDPAQHAARLARYRPIMVTFGSRRANSPERGIDHAYMFFAIAAIVGIIGRGVPLFSMVLIGGVPLFTLIGIVGVINAYVSRAHAHGTWLESHVDWLIHTFWWSVLGLGICWFLAASIIGWPLVLVVWAATMLWVTYRVVKGYMRFHRSEAISGP